MGEAPSWLGMMALGYTFGDDNAGMSEPLMEDQLGMGGSFALDHEFSEDYDLHEEDDEVDIEGEPLFEEPLPAKANAKKKRKSKRTKAYTQDEGKLFCECWRYIGQDPKTGSEQKASTFWQDVQPYDILALKIVHA
ncbi:DNA repair protein rhp54 [Hordeum vulgare]|nr:DNA repair protein rhp54 [Hordeum vulgare]